MIETMTPSGVEQRVRVYCTSYRHLVIETMTPSGVEQVCTGFALETRVT